MVLFLLFFRDGVVWSRYLLYLFGALLGLAAGIAVIWLLLKLDMGPRGIWRAITARWRPLGVLWALLALAGLFGPWWSFEIGFGALSERTMVIQTSPFAMTVEEQWRLGSIREHLNTTRTWLYSGSNAFFGAIGLAGVAMSIAGYLGSRAALSLTGGLLVLTSVAVYPLGFGRLPEPPTLDWGFGLTLVGGLVTTTISIAMYTKERWGLTRRSRHRNM